VCAERVVNPRQGNAAPVGVGWRTLGFLHKANVVRIAVLREAFPLAQEPVIDQPFEQLGGLADIHAVSHVVAIAVVEQSRVERLIVDPDKFDAVVSPEDCPR